MKKKIIFAAPKPFIISDKISKALKESGFEVVDISYDGKFTYRNTFQRIGNFIRKNVLRDKGYKTSLKFKPFDEPLKKLIENHSNENKIDYAFFIRPDLYPKSFIKWVAQRVETTIAYQWDGFKKFPQIKGYEILFDRFFVFDEVDLKGKTLPLTNFYFDCKKNGYEVNLKEVYFVGAQVRNRIKSIEKMVEYINKVGFESNIMLFKFRPKQKDIDCAGITYIEHPISYEENLRNVLSAGVLIDFHGGIHNGLSFRAFESIGYSKKLITNNPAIKKYDFYNENNVFVWENDNFEGLDIFLQKPYQPIDEKIREKYSFSNWINYVLGIEPHEEIELPNH